MFVPTIYNAKWADGNRGYAQVMGVIYDDLITAPFYIIWYQSINVQVVIQTKYHWVC